MESIYLFYLCVNNSYNDLIVPCLLTFIKNYSKFKYKESVQLEECIIRFYDVYLTI